jgi:hypothetical protein
MFPNQQVRSKDDVFAYAVLTVRVHSKEIEMVQNSLISFNWQAE